MTYFLDVEFSTCEAVFNDVATMLSASKCRLAVPKHSSEEALVRIAGATTMVNAVNGFSAGDAIPVPRLFRCGSRFY